MKAADFDIDKLVQNLQGTCGTLQDAISSMYPDMTEDDLTEDDHNYIDNEIFLCPECNWWCEASEEAEGDHDERTCEGCIEE